MSALTLGGWGAMAMSCLAAALFAAVWRVWSPAEPHAEDAICAISLLTSPTLLSHLPLAEMAEHHLQDEPSSYLRFVLYMYTINYLCRLIVS